MVRRLDSITFFTSDLRYEAAFNETSSKKEGSTHCTHDMDWASSRTDLSNDIALVNHILFHIFFHDFYSSFGRNGYHFDRRYVMGNLQV